MTFKNHKSLNRILVWSWTEPDKASGGPLVLSSMLKFFSKSKIEIITELSGDPKKRRSNVNKDLRAIGVATVVSGLLGGINVVSVIARSSVNVNNGATNRLSNLFHGIFLAVFVLIFTAFLSFTLFAKPIGKPSISYEILAG